MKKIFFIVLLGSTMLSFYSCGSNTETKTHTHSDGATHADHDTTKPAQQEFNVSDSTKKDTTTHTHDDSTPHAH